MAVLAFVVNNAVQERGSMLKREEQTLQEKQKIYSELGKGLNVIYVYVKDVGDFRSYTPETIVDRKRTSDRTFYMYRSYWSPSTEKNYKDFMDATFATYNGAGIPAKIRASPALKKAAYDFDHLEWKPTWDAYFADQMGSDVEKKYYALVSSLLNDTVNFVVRP